MKVSELEALFRFRFKDTDSQEYMVSTERYLSLLNSVYKEAVFRGDLIPEFSSSATQFTTDQSSFKLKGGMYAVTHCTCKEGQSGTRYPVDVVSRETLDSDRPDWRNATPSKPEFAFFEKGVVRLFPPPDKTYTFDIEGFRYGAVLTSPSQEPEILDHVQSALNDGVLAILYGMPGEDYFNASENVARSKEFDRVFGPARSIVDYADRYCDRPHLNREVLI